MAVSGRELFSSLDTFEIMLYRSLVGIFLVLSFGKYKEITCHPGATTAECVVLCLGYLFYVWDISLMYIWDLRLMSGILVLCLGY